MTRTAFRIAWTITWVAALGLLALTVFLGMRERALPPAAVAAPVITPATAEETGPATESAGATASSPAGNGLIAFVSDRDGNPEIYVMQPDGSGQTRISDDPGDDLSPSWTLDGSRLVWLHSEQSEGETPVWSAVTAAPDGSDRRTVIDGPGWPIAGAENPATAQAALYVVEDSNGNGEPDLEDIHRLLLIDLAQPEEEPTDLLARLEGIAPSQSFGSGVLQWSVDGATLYLLLDVNGEDGLYALPVAGGPPEMLGAGDVELAALSPDGAQMAIWRANEDTGRRRRRIFLHELETGRETPFLMGGLAFQTINGLQWSRDGSRLIFAGFSGASAPDIYVLDVPLDALTSLSQQVAEPAFEPALSPDGTQIVFQAQPFRAAGQTFEPAGDANLYLVDDLGSDTSQLTDGQGNNYDPAWQPLFR